MLRLCSFAPVTLLAGLLLLGGCSDEDSRLPFVSPLTPLQVVRGPTPIFFTLISAGDPANVVVQYSTDLGVTFDTATPAAGTASTQQLQASPAGVSHSFFWDPLADLDAGIHRLVIIRMVPIQKKVGGGGDTAPFTVDLTDRLDPITGGPTLSRVVAAPLPDGTVWIGGGETPSGFAGGGQRYNPVTNSFDPVSGVFTQRRGPGFAALKSGQVLVAGGELPNAAPSALVEFFRVNPDGSTNSQAATNNLLIPRIAPLVAPLPDGDALIVGGDVGGGVSTPTVEIYRHSTGTLSTAFTTPLAARRGGTATLLQDGRVLIAGGWDDQGVVHPNAMLIDAQGTGATSLVSPGVQGEHGSTLLPDGRVFFVGGTGVAGDDSVATTAVNQFDPTLSSFKVVAPLQRSRRNPGVAYAGGAVVAFGGSGHVEAPTTVERYDFATGAWVDIAQPGLARREAIAISTGPGFALVLGDNVQAERYYSDASLTVASWDPLPAVPDPRSDHTASTLSNSDLLLVGGTSGITSGLATVQRYVFLDSDFVAAPNLATGRAGHVAVNTGVGILVAGGQNDQGLVAQAELYDEQSNTWQAAGSMVTPRIGATATLTGVGALITGGVDLAGVEVTTSELWDPFLRTFSNVALNLTPKQRHSSVRTFSGLTIVGPGRSASGLQDTIQVVDGAANSVSTITGDVRAGAALSEIRFANTILVSGGEGPNGVRDDLTFLDPRVVPPVFLPNRPSLKFPRFEHDSIVLTDNRVLLVNGRGPSGLVDQGEFYTFTGAASFENGSTFPTGDPRQVKARVDQTATLLRDGRVLILGGRDERGIVIAGAEIFLP